MNNNIFWLTILKLFFARVENTNDFFNQTNIIEDNTSEIDKPVQEEPDKSNYLNNNFLIIESSLILTLPLKVLFFLAFLKRIIILKFKFITNVNLRFEQVRL